MVKIPSKFSELPKNWEVISIGKMLKDKILLGHMDGNHGGDYPRSDEFVSEGISYISANSIIRGNVDFSLAKYLTLERASKLRKGKAKNGDVLFAHNATVGPVALLQTESQLVILSTTLTYYRCNSEILSNHYLKAYLESEFFRKQYEPLMAQSTRNQVPITTQREFYIPLPPLAEQKAIAQILGTWDEAIQVTEALIDALRRRKQGLMQRLLTGEVRFPEFGQSGDMKRYHRMGNISSHFEVEKLTKHLKLRRDWIEIENGEQYNRCTVKLHNIGIVPRDTIQGSDIRTKKQQITKEGDLLVAEIDAKVGGFGIVKPDTSGSIVSSHYYLFDILDSLNIDFLEQCIFEGLLERQVDAIGSTNYAAIRARDVLNYMLPIPNKNEQSRISEILVTADDVINTLTNYSKQLQKQKRGLMQMLLTGQMRVGV